MEWLHIEPILDLIELVDTPSSLEKRLSFIMNSPLRHMFGQFQVPEEEVKRCLAAALSGEEDHSGLSKDCTELIAYIENIRKREEELRLFFGLMGKREASIREEAIKMAREYLPPSASFEKLNVYFVPMPYNANADNLGVYFDPIFAMDIGLDAITGVMAHEAHHIGRNSVTSERLEFGDKPLEMLAYRFMCLETEGIANLVNDASKIPFLKRIALTRAKIMAEFEKHLELLQEVFLNLAGGVITDREARALMSRSWFTTGSLAPIGMKMAIEIENEFGKENLVKTVGDTVAFLKAYQKVALKKNYYLLEDETFDNLEKLLKARP